MRTGKTERGIRQRAKREAKQLIKIEKERVLGRNATPEYFYAN